MKILFILLFIIYPKLVFSDPMNVVDDWELLDNSFSKELFSSNKEYKLFIEDSESLVLLNMNNNEQCDIATIDELKGSVTIIAISHQQTFVDASDKTFLLEAGELSQQA